MQFENPWALLLLPVDIRTVQENMRTTLDNTGQLMWTVVNKIRMSLKKIRTELESIRTALDSIRTTLDNI